MTLTQGTRLSVVPDRPACYLTRAAPLCRDALLRSLINFTCSLSIGVSSDRFGWVLFRNHGTSTGRAVSRAFEDGAAEAKLSRTSALPEADHMRLTMSTPRRRRSIKSWILLAPAILGGLCLALLTQATSAQSGASPPLNTMSYLPSISDFMIATIQPRHVRLWAAARREDWSFAAYELGNLKGAFDRLSRAHPVEHEIPLQEMISSVTSQPFEDMHKAIESRDRVAFSKAYGDLTSACNACHEATNHGVVVIRAPTDSLISDQDFERAAP
jgi:hypothetical protein